MISWRVVINQSPNSLHFIVGDANNFTIALASFKQMEFAFVGIEKLLSFKIPPRTQQSTHTEDSSLLDSSEGSLHALDIAIIIMG